MLSEFFDAVGISEISKIQGVRVQMVSNSIVLVSNMLGILTLEQDKIELKADKNQLLIIEGDYLEVITLNKNDISVRGRIRSVNFSRA